MGLLGVLSNETWYINNLCKATSPRTKHKNQVPLVHIYICKAEVELGWVELVLLVTLASFGSLGS